MSDINFSNIKRVLVTKLRFHGDVLLSSPVFQSLKKHYPHLEVDALIYEETSDMLSLNPAVDQIFTVDKKWKESGIWQQLTHERQLLKQLSSRQYDLIIHLTEHWRGFYLKHLLKIPFAVTAEYPRRKDSHLWQRCFTHIYPVPPARDKAASHIDALRILGINAPAAEEQTSFVIGQTDQNHVQKLIKQHHLICGSYILIHPTSRFFYKCWPPHKMAEYITALNDRGNKIVITAAPNSKEADYIDRMMSSITAPVINLSGQLSLKQLGAIIQKSGGFVGVDSAPMHIAAAVNTPIVALFGPTDTNIWGPKSNQATVLKSDSSRKPALVNGSRPNEIENCTLDFNVDQVLETSLKRFALK